MRLHPRAAAIVATLSPAALRAYWHVELEQHDLVIAEGLATESYLNCGNRGAFEGEADALILHPSYAISAYAAHEGSCLPWVVAGPVLEKARAMLAARSGCGTHRRRGVLNRGRRRRSA